MAKIKGIYKRGNIFWIRYAGLDGRIIFESSGSKKFREAQDLLISRKQGIKEGKEPEIKRITNHTFKELTEHYSKWAEMQKCFKSKIYLIKDLATIFGMIPLRRFNTMIVEQYVSEKLQKGYKPSTANRLLATLKHMFSKAVEWDMVEETILKRIRKVKFLKENNARLRYLSKEECKSLVNACDSHLRPIVIAGLNTGMRKQEILSLTWDDIDLKHGFIHVNTSKNGERRDVPMNNTLKAVLQGITRRLDIPYVFYDSKTGKHFQDVKRSFHTSLRKAGIKDFHFHDMRHTFASHLVMAGVDLTTVSKLLGHKTLTMTLRYSHLAPEHMVKAVGVLDENINENKLASCL